MKAVWDVGRRLGSEYPPLYKDEQVDVAVIGAGITGLTTALRLAESGKRVAVVESGRVGGGATGNSTGNLYANPGSTLSTIRKKWGDEVAHTVVEARRAGIALIEETVRRFNIDCQFKRLPWYLCAPPDRQEYAAQVEREYEACRIAGLQAHLERSAPVSVPTGDVLRVDDQAQFNPLRYVQGLAGAVEAAGAKIYEESRVIGIDTDQGVVETNRARLHAENIVHATHTPKGISVLQAEMMVYREYGISAKLHDGVYPDGSFWLLGDAFYSVRSYHADGQDFLIVVGEKHKTGHGTEDEAHYEALRGFVRRHFAVESFEHAWSAQQFQPADELPYIGRAPLAPRSYVATGFKADGLAWGATAAVIISDLILDRDERWGGLFAPQRFTPLKSAKQLLQENLTVAEHFVKDYLGGAKGGIEELRNGEGRVVSLEGEKLAVYRDESGRLSVLSAVCPHMKCIVHWNADDRQWECPCHGSRFATDGRILDGPALVPLEQRAPRA